MARQVYMMRCLAFISIAFTFRGGFIPEHTLKKRVKISRKQVWKSIKTDSPTISSEEFHSFYGSLRCIFKLTLPKPLIWETSRLFPKYWSLGNGTLWKIKWRRPQAWPHSITFLSCHWPQWNVLRPNTLNLQECCSRQKDMYIQRTWPSDF